jgi:hypothetical protein
MVFNVGVIREMPLSEEQRRLSPVSEKLYAALMAAGVFPPVEKDRFMADEVAALTELVIAGGVLDIVETEMPLPW